MMLESVSSLRDDLFPRALFDIAPANLHFTSNRIDCFKDAGWIILPIIFILLSLLILGSRE
eukprot:scaffold8097_cov73-Skeletonema_marinoi.AAC.2